MSYQPLDASRDEFRLLTILPLAPGSSDSAPVECYLQKFCLNDEHFTPAYKKYLNDKNATGAWNDPREYSERLIQGDELGDWTEIVQPSDDATTHLPEFRYEWGDFMAISYTWGGSANVREILVNGQPLMVTQNAEACLRVLQSKQYVQNGWKFWIDAICINQNDIIERASLVKRMREIYTKAWTPIIWLGEQEGSSDEALDLITTLAGEYSSPDGVSRLTDALHRNAQHFGKGVWRALYELICRPYWRRLWIFQEAALGRSTTPILCGHRTLSWIHVARAFSLLIKTDEVINTYITNELRDAFIPFNIAIWANLYTANEIQSLQDIQLQGKRTNTYRLLNLSRLVFSTDPRDKVYGLLGLMDESLASLIEPDYTDTVLNVYRSFTLTIIEATGSLDVIRHTAPAADSPFPSWVPDWTVAPKTTALTLSETSFATSGSSLASIQTLTDSQLLSCKGFIIDRFDGMGAMWAKGWSPDSIVPTKGTANPYGTFEGVRDAIWKSMVACRSLPSEPLNVDHGSLLATPLLAEMGIPEHSPLKDVTSSNVFLWCVRSLKSNAGFQVAGRRMEEYFWKKAEPEDIDAMHLRDALMQKDRVGERRRLVTTGRGYVGMALETIERSDAIAVLLGCSMPVVLRKVEGGSGHVRWQVVGECYIHGIMDGEAMEWGMEAQDIVLC
jgi:hypothetical protein